MGFPIRKSSDQRVFAPPRRLSQRITSFIACACQGIHQLPLRHLIVHIANIHQNMNPNPLQDPASADGYWTLKRPASRDLSDGAVRQTNHMRKIERLTRRTPPINTRSYLNSQSHPLQIRLPIRNPNKSSLHNVIQNRQANRSSLQTYIFSVNDVFPTHRPDHLGGAERDRTADPLLAKQVLSQLSYSPSKVLGNDGGPG